MSVVLAIAGNDFAALACDGRLSHRNPDGSLTPVGEFGRKIYPLTEFLAVGITGSSYLSNLFVERLERIVEENRENSKLFQMLADELSALVSNAISIAARNGVGVEGVGVVLLGWDAVQNKMRHLNWSTEEPIYEARTV